MTHWVVSVYFYSEVSQTEQQRILSKKKVQFFDLGDAVAMAEALSKMKGVNTAIVTRVEESNQGVWRNGKQTS